MEGWLKMLVAAACLVVIGWGGYLGWAEYQRQSDIAAGAQALEDLVMIKKAQRAKPTEQDAGWMKQQENAALWSRCHNAANDLRSYNVLTNPNDVRPKVELIALIKQCAVDGRLNKDDAADMRSFIQ